MQTINERIELLLNDLEITKTAFAESLKVSQPYISKLIKTGYPSDLLIQNICDRYNVREDWLRNGTGTMYRELSRNAEIAQFAADLFKEEEDSFKNRLLFALARLNEEDWEDLERIAQKIIKKQD